MKVILYGTYDRTCKFFDCDSLMMFHSPDDARAHIVAGVRAMYAMDILDDFWLKEHEIRAVAYFDTLTGAFEEVPPDDVLEVNLYNAVLDLKYEKEVKKDE